MKNKFVLFAVSSALLLSILGCSYYNPLESSSNSSTSRNSSTSKSNDKSLSDKAIDSTIGQHKIGIPECDEVMDVFAELAKSDDDSFVTKAAREYALNAIRESFKQSIEENKGDKERTAKECRKFKDQLDKYKAEEDSKKNAK